MKIDDREFNQICGLMLNRYGITLERKRSLIEGRLSGLLAVNGFADFREFMRAVATDEKLQQVMVTRLTTNFTYFQREEMHYEYMVREAIPSILTASPFKTNLKIWSAGCSTGDEAYTAAVYLSEMSFLNPRVKSFTIHATDISDNVLAQAKEGVYASESLKNVSAPLKKRYFSELPGGRWQISPKIAEKVHFSKMNLMDPFPPMFHGFDIIFCRNVMIYFTPEIRRRLAGRYFAALNPGGYLFIGMSETIPAVEIGFHVMRPSVFRKEG